jgi:prevent-host-death family protein
MAASALITDEISTQDLRQKVGEVFARVQYSRKPLIVTRQGREVGVILSMEWLDDIRKLEQQRARREALGVLSAAAKAGINDDQSDEEVAELARELLGQGRGAKRKRPSNARSK